MKYNNVLPLDFSLNTYAIDDFFISSCNIEAYSIITNGNVLWPNNRAIILGQRYSGKTHLASIWQQKCNAIKLNYYENINIDLQSIGNNYLIDDLHLFNVKNIEYENWLFSVMNQINNSDNMRLLITSKEIPNFTLEDLNSRIRASYIAKIGDLQVDLLEVLTQKYLYDKQLNVSGNVIKYIVKHIIKTNLSFDYLYNIIKIINKEYSRISPNVELTVKFIHNIIKNIMIN